MTNLVSRPSILCVRPVRHDERSIPSFMHDLKTEWIRALSCEVNVHTADGDFDMREMMDRHEPDLVVFDSLDGQHTHLPEITHPLANPDVPRAAYLNTDPHEPTRPLFHARWQDYGMSVVFQQSGALYPGPSSRPGVRLTIHLKRYPAVTFLAHIFVFDIWIIRNVEYRTRGSFKDY